MRFSIMDSRFTDTIKQFPNVPTDVVDRFKRLDPTENKKYLNWMMEMWVQMANKVDKERIASRDQTSVDWAVYHLIDIATDFHKWSRLYPADKRDIYSYEGDSPNGIINQIYQQSKDARIRKDSKDLEKELVNSADKIYSDDDLSIVIPRTFEASCKYGANTKWCTTAFDNPNHYNEYMEKGPLFYLIYKPGAEFSKVAIAVDDEERTWIVYDDMDEEILNGDAENFVFLLSFKKIVSEKGADAMLRYWVMGQWGDE